MRLTEQEYNEIIVKKKSARTKFGNIKKEVDGFKFDSTKEANHYQDLKLRVHNGEINTLQLQKKFSLDVNNIHICNYICDFFFYDQDGVAHIQDVKSTFTAKNPVYRLKKKMMKAILNFTIEEII